MWSTNRISAYMGELAYCYVATNDVQSCTRLIWHTARFHIHNARGAPIADDSPFSVDLRIAEDFKTKLQLRPFAGDLFVLYEVLMRNAYHVPPSKLPPDEVKTIVDCGANIGLTSLFFASRYRNARIFSIEPHPVNYDLLKKNTNCEPRIVPIQAAIVGEPRSTVKLSVHRAAWENLLSNDNTGVDVPAMTLSQICELYHLNRVDLPEGGYRGRGRGGVPERRFLASYKIRYHRIAWYLQR